jgi:hypothetical protein
VPSPIRAGNRAAVLTPIPGIETRDFDKRVRIKHPFTSDPMMNPTGTARLALTNRLRHNVHAATGRSS